MSEAKTSPKMGRPARSLSDEIAAVEQKLAALKAKQREDERRELERNQKAIYGLLKRDGLDSISAEKWTEVLPKLRELLRSEKKASPKATPVTDTPNSPEQQQVAA